MQLGVAATARACRQAVRLAAAAACRAHFAPALSPARLVLQRKAEGLVRQAAAAGAQIILLQELFEAPYFCQVRKRASNKGA